MKPILLSFLALACIQVSVACAGIVAANNDDISTRYRIEPVSRSATPTSSYTDRNTQQARHGHGGEEDLYFEQIHRNRRAVRSG
jgi:hypothetical protein